MAIFLSTCSSLPEVFGALS